MFCPYHGYYRGDRCPECGRRGMKLMDDEEAEALSRRMVAALRHVPERYGIQLDEHGFVPIKELTRAIRRKRGFRWVREVHIVAIAMTDERGRYELREGKIRATYGHTLEVDLSDFPAEAPEKLYFPCTPEEAEFLLEMGIRPSDRSWVHLSSSREKAREAAMARGIAEPVILEVDARRALEDGVFIRKAGREVYIAKEIPPQYVRVSE